MTEGRLTVRQFLALGPNDMPSMIAVEALYNENVRLRSELSSMRQTMAFLVADFTTIIRCANGAKEDAIKARDRE